jgi:hypothetical protein
VAKSFRSGIARARVIIASALVVAALTEFARAAVAQPDSAVARADSFLIVDCLLPGQVRQLGRRTKYLSARRPARLPARDCEIRGGEYVAYDRADLKSALAAWLPLATAGDVQARILVGEIYERGLGVAPDYQQAAHWYRLAADAGSARAQVNLGHLYELGLGLEADPREALSWYRRAAGLSEAIELDPTALEPPVTAALTIVDRTEEIAALQRELRQRSEEAAAAAQALADARAEQQRLQRALEEAGRKSASENESSAATRSRLQAADEHLARLDAELAARNQEITRLQGDLAQQQAAAASATSLAASRQAELARLQQPIAEHLLAGPQLALIEPQLTRTRDIVPVAMTIGAEREVIGQVTAPAGAISVTLNEAPVEINERGVFVRRLSVSPGDMPVSIVAVDRQGKRAELRFVLRGKAAPAAEPAASSAADAEPTPLAGIDFGAYHALVIGDNDYQYLPHLASPVNDATELATLLEQRYGFQTTLLLNANRYQILSALNVLRERLTAHDNLLIYFAGHGELDEVNQRGHWLPVDAERDNTANWLPTTAITDILNIMNAKQVLVIVDSCYAGALTRSAMVRLRAGTTQQERVHWMRTMAVKRSRTVLTSGGLAPVMDAGGGRHSVFAKALLEVLAANQDVLDGQRLHREVAARVAYAAANMSFDQVPEYAPIRYAGHEAGEFFLVPRN